MLDKIKLEYVESAWIILYQLTHKEPHLLEQTTELFQTNLNFVLNKFKDSELLFSGLYNAFTEDKNVDRLKTVTPFVDNHGLHEFQYADSGGLQIVNTGASINDELKRQIYSHQAQNSDFAFSFDEIPSFRNPDKTRTYVNEWVAPYGTKAGKSLQEQIDIFKTLGTDCKIIPIIQGYNHTQIETYTKNMLNEVKKKDLKEIGAIACGNAHSNGFGTLDNFMALQTMDIPASLKKHTHLLGVSGIDRLAPILTVVRNGLANDMERLSFDSSYHTQSYVYGEVQRSTQHLLSETKIHRLGLTRNDYVEARFTEMKEFWKDCDTFNFDDLEDMFKHSIYDSEGINSPAKHLKERSEEAYIKNVNIIQMHILFNIYKYIQLLEDFISDKISFYDVFHNDKYFKFYSGLLNAKSISDYFDWRNAAINKYKFARAKNVMYYKDLNPDATDFLF